MLFPGEVTVAWIIGPVALAGAMFWLHLRGRRQVRQLAARLSSAEKAHQQANEDKEAALKALHIREEFLGKFLNSTRDIALVYSIEEGGKPGRFTQLNDAACTLLGYTREQLLTKNPSDIELVAGPSVRTESADTDSLTIANADMLASQNSFATRFFGVLLSRVEKEKQVVYEGRYVTQAGTVIPVEVTACRVDIGEQSAVVCFAHDIRERKKRETELLAKERLLRDFINKTTVGVAVYDGQGKLLTVNPACMKMFGAPDSNEFERFSLLDNRFFADTVREAVRRGDSLQTEIKVNFDEIVGHALFVSSRRGEGHFHLLITNLGLDDRFNPRGHIVQAVDTTEQRATEETLRQTLQQLRQAQKMEVIGMIAGGIAHDFNNVLTPIMGYAGMALELPIGDAKMRPFLQEILTAARRARELVAQILAFSRQDVGTNAPMNLIPIIKEVVKQRAAVLPPNMQIQYVIKEADGMVRASPTQIHQILTNLTRNAEQAMKGSGGTIEIRLTSFVLTSLHRKEYPSLVTKEYVRDGGRRRFIRLSVRDTGCGMSPETMKRIFDTFFTTKKEGEGTGMGLAVVRGHVAAMGGAISVESTPGKGTVFNVALPLIEATEEKCAVAEVVMPGNRERILFVDDEIAVVRMASLMLESLGYEAVVTSQSTKALDMIRANPKHFDLLITDQVMPEMTGMELVREVLKVRPDMAIILCTGYSEKVSQEEALKQGIRVYLAKPVERSEMTAAIQRALIPPTDPVEDSPEP
jgi:signal transduction histidine kinase/ActR/RegA family two-component response regulator